MGKGWYNLAESNFEAYRFSKLRRFLTLVRFGMEDTLRLLVEGSITKFVAFMQVCAQDSMCLALQGQHSILCSFDHSSRRGFTPGCLHTCNLCLRSTAAALHTDLLQRLCERQHLYRPGGGAAA